MTNLKTSICGVLAAGLMTTSAMAGGLERGTFSSGFLFEKGNYIEGSLGHVEPSVTGNVPVLNLEISNIAPSYNVFSAALKLQLTDTISLGFMAYQPIGYRLEFPTVAPVITAPTSAEVTSQAYVGMVKAKLNDNFHVYGGLTYVHLEGEASNLNPLLPPSLRFESDDDYGYIVGAAYTRDEIALRIALTYESGTQHELATFGPGLGGPNTPYGITTGGTPEAYTLEFQTGIAPKTLLFGSIRHALHSGGDVILPTVLGGANISEFSDTTTYSLGVGRRVTERLSLSISGTYEGGSGNPSDLNPTDGKKTLAMGAKFSVTENLHLSFGASHTWLGDNETVTGSLPFEDNTAWAYGGKIGINF